MVSLVGYVFCWRSLYLCVILIVSHACCECFVWKELAWIELTSIKFLTQDFWVRVSGYNSGKAGQCTDSYIETESGSSNVWPLTKSLCSSLVSYSSNDIASITATDHCFTIQYKHHLTHIDMYQCHHDFTAINIINITATITNKMQMMIILRFFFWYFSAFCNCPSPFSTWVAVCSTL